MTAVPGFGRAWAAALGVALLLAQGGCGGDPPAGGAGTAAKSGGGGGAASAALASQDPAVAGPAVFRAWRDAIDKHDGKALLARMSHAMRAEGIREVERMQARLREDPQQATEMKRRLGLQGNPAEMPPEELLALEAGRRLRDDGAEFFDRSLGAEFLDARREGALLVLRAKAPTALASEAPDGVAETAHTLEDGGWVMDLEATDRMVSRWVRTAPVPPGDFDRGMTFTPDRSRLVLWGPQGVLLLPFEGTGAPVHLPVAEVSTVLVDPQGGWIVTSASWGAEARALGSPPEPESAPVAVEAAETPHLGVTLWSLDGQKQRTLTTEAPRALAVSPDGRRLALVTLAENGQTVGVMDVATGASSTLLVDQEIHDVAFVGNDRLLLQLGTGDLRLHALTGKRLLTIPHPSARGFRVHAKAQRVAASLETRDDKGVSTFTSVIYDLASGEEVARAPAGWNSRMEFSPDGAQLALAGRTVKRVDATRGTLRREHGMGRADLDEGAFAFHPMGRWLVALGEPVVTQPSPGDDPPRAPPVLHVFRADE